MIDRRTSWVTRALVMVVMMTIAAVSILHLVGVVSEALGGRPQRVGLDYQAFVAAGELVRTGDADLMYDPDALEARGLARTAFVYPPWAALAMVPWSLLPLGLGLLAWTVLGLGVMVAGLRAAGVTDWRPLGLAMISLPAVFALGLGQSTFLFVGVVAFTVAAMERNEQRAGGRRLAASGWKPHLLAGFGLLWAVDSRSWRVQAGWTAATTLVLVVASEALLPGSWWAWLRFLAGSSEDLSSAVVEASLPGMISLLMGPQGAARWLVFGAIIVVGIPAAIAVLRSRHDGDLLPRIAFALTVGLLFVPHVVIYDALVLVIPLSVLISTRFRRDATLVGLVLAFGLSVGPYLTNAQLDAWSRALDVSTLSVVFAAVVFGLWCRRDDPLLPMSPGVRRSSGVRADGTP